MSAIYLDLMSACRLNVDALEAEHVQAAMDVKPEVKKALIEQRGLITGVHGDTRQILWADHGRLRYCPKTGALLIAEVPIRYLLPAKLGE